MELFEHQRLFLEKNADKSALVWSCGTGKTRTAIEWAMNKIGLTVIICPKALKENWIRECRKVGIENAWVMTKEEFKRGCIAGKIDPCKSLIVDEVHNGFLTPQFKSQMSKCLRDYLVKNKIERVLLLSATVYTSSPWNIYSLATLLGHKWSWQGFNFKYFDQVRMGGRIIPMPKKGVEVQMAKLVRDIADVVDIHDCMDVPEQLHTEPEYFALTDEQETGLKDNFDPVHIVRMTRQHEIENGILLGDENGLVADQTFDCDKMARIRTLVEENEKIAIVCRYNAQIDLIRDSLLALERPIFVIRGDTRDRDRITLAAERAKSCIVLIQADCAEGYNLPSFELCVFASMSFSYAKFVQVCGRFLRIDFPSRTTFIYLISGEKSVDQAVYDAIQRKQDFQVALYSRGIL